ncbi:MAG: DUF1345 domain-containing protein [Pseudomonadota bacterium]|nr:DUF1345 domain-containing protein [Pseudomonadota bacterium]
MSESRLAVPSRRARSRWPFPPRFVLFLVALPLAVAALAPLAARWGQAVLGGFDVAALVFIVSLWPLTRDHAVAQMRARARANDTGRVGMLIITSLMVIVILTAVTVELPGARHETGVPHTIALALVLVSLVIAWLFSNLIFALHYAHLYYRDQGEGGLSFPRPDAETDTESESEYGAESGPDYIDFVYFALTIGMAFATADISIPGRAIRRTAIVHAIAAFFYNLIVLAFTINVTASG